jgi:pyruvate kinase
MRRNRLAKIVATIGPASASTAMLRRLSQTGVDCFRVNFSHGTHADHGEVIARLRNVEAETGRPIAILADLQGPKIRLGDVAGGEMSVRYGDRLIIEAGLGACEEGVLRLPHPEMIAAGAPGGAILIDDGKIRLAIEEAHANRLVARVDVGGAIKPRKGATLIGAALPISALTDKDRADLAFALDAGVDWAALSFVQRVADLEEARALIGGRTGLVAKIEKPSAIQDMAAIVAASDAIMVARGDLGVELPAERVPIEQRRLIRVARTLGKPVIVATHMLESMIEAASPTRAEASDVASAIYQGADAVMLSAESAVGRHPESAVAIMDRIIAAVEGDPEHWRGLDRPPVPAPPATADAVSLAAREIADVLGCAAIVAYTRTGATALRVARERPPCPVLVMTPEAGAARRLALVWGAQAHVGPDIMAFDEMVARAEAHAKAEGLGADQRIVIIAGAPFGQPGKTNTIKISRLAR